jgi:hypothetical protein
MGADVMFLDCPEYLDRRGRFRCGLPAEVADRYALESTDGPLESVRIRCPRGHWFNGPLESLLRNDSRPVAEQPGQAAGSRPMTTPHR